MSTESRILTRKEVIKEVQATFELPTIKAAAEQLEKFEGMLLKMLNEGNRVRLNGLGTLRKEVRPAHECRVPGTDRTVQVPTRYGFKLASKSFEA